MKATQPQQNASLYVVGQDWGPSQIPMSVVQLGGNGGAYAELYSFEGPDGSAIRAMYSGTYGSLVPAGRRR